jgi:hypothetical protein
VLKDFEPISLVTTQPLLIVAKKSMPANDLQELIAWLRANPNKASAVGQAQAAPITLPPCSSKQKPARNFNSCRIAAAQKNAGLVGGTNRYDFRSCRQRRAANPCRKR